MFLGERLPGDGERTYMAEVIVSVSVCETDITAPDGHDVPRIANSPTAVMTHNRADVLPTTRWMKEDWRP